MKKIWMLFILGAGILTVSCSTEKKEILIGQSQEIVQEQAAESEEDSDDGEESGDSGEKKATVWVDVCGAVKKPGVYELEEDSRVFQAIEAAGGFSEDADALWLNQAAILSDGEKIQVYTLEETQAMKDQGIVSSEEEKAASEEENEKININEASVDELQDIPGIGEVRAQAIADYREESGGFKSIEDIQEVPGIKGKTFEKIADYITVE